MSRAILHLRRPDVTWLTACTLCSPPRRATSERERVSCGNCTRTYLYRGIKITLQSASERGAGSTPARARPR